MDENLEKKSFYNKLKYANYNLMYLTFVNYSTSLYVLYFFNLIEIFQILSLSINDGFKNIWKGSKFYLKVCEFLKYWRILRYSDNNENLYLFILIIICLIIIFDFVIFLYLLILSFNQNPLKKFLLQIFYHLSIFLGTIFLVPNTEILFSMIVCDNELYFKSKFKCWKFEHLIFLIISSVCYLFLIIITILFQEFYFIYNEKFSNNLSRYLISNPQIIFSLIKSFTVVLLQFQCVKNIIYVVIIFQLLTSILNSYNYYIQKKLGNSNNIFDRLNFVFSLIYCLNCICVFIGKLIEKNNFNGMFEIFIVGCILIIILILTFPKVTILNKKYFNFSKNDKIIFENIFLILNELENQNKKRENLLNIFSYFSEYKLTEKFNIKSVEKLTNEEIEYYILLDIENLYKNSINIFRNSVLLNLSYSIFEYEKLKKYNKSYINLLKISNLNLNLSQEFFIYRIKRKLQEKGIFEGIDLTNLSFKFQCNKLISMIYDLCLNFIDFWNLVLSCTEYSEFQRLNFYGNKINYLLDKIEEKYILLEKGNFSYNKIKILFGYFLRDVLNDYEKSKDFLSNHNFNEFQFLNENVLNIKNLNSDNLFHFIVVSGEKKTFEEILKISEEFCSYLGYYEEQLIGKKISFLLPNYIRLAHEKMLKKKILKFFYDTINLKVLNENKNIKTLELVFINSSKFAVPLIMDVIIINDENYNPIFFGKINYDFININLSLNDKINMNIFPDRDFLIITNEKLLIQNFTSNCLNNLQLDNNMINSNIEISFFIKELSEDFLNKIYENPNENPLKTKILLIHQKYLKQNIITWKSNKKYKLIVSELKIDKKIYGFNFNIFFDVDSSVIGTAIGIKRMSIVSSLGRGSIENRKSVSNQDKKSLIFQSRCNEEITITKNFMPEFQSIQFDMKEKMFLMNTKKNYENENSVNDYFNNIFMEDKNNFIIKLNTKKDSNSTSKQTEKTEENDSSSLINEEEEEEENEEKEEKKEEKIENENNDLNYYKIKNNKIKFLVYDFNLNVSHEVKSYEFQSKVEEIINLEKNITNSLEKKKIIKAPSNYENLNKKNNEHQNLLGSYKRETIQKLINPKLLNNSVLFSILLYFINITVFLIISIFYFYYAKKYCKNIKQINTFINYQANLFRYILHSYLTSMEMVLLKNHKYTNLYQKNNRDLYYEECKNYLIEIYNKSKNELHSFSFEKITISDKIQKEIDNIIITTNLYYVYPNFTVAIDTTEMNLYYSLSEYDFILLSFVINEDEINPLNVRFLYLVFNGEYNINGLNSMINLYFQELDIQIKNIRKIIWFLFIVFFVFEIVMIFIGLKASIYLVSEKEIYLNYFFKIEEKKINIIMQNNMKFLMINKNTNLISEPKIDFEDIFENNNNNINKEKSIENFSSIEDEKKKINFVIKKRNPNSGKFKYNLITDNPLIRKNLLMISLFYIFMLMLLLYVTYYFSSNIIIIPNYGKIFYITLYIERAIFGKYNFVRAFNFFNPLKNSISAIGDYFIEQVNYLYDAYQENSNFVRYISRNTTETNINEVKKLFSKAGKNSFCEYFENATKYDITCETVASNITNYGIYSVFSFLFDNYYFLTMKIQEMWDFAEKNNLTYNEMLYGTSGYSNILPEDSEQLEYYHKHNPFTIFNEDTSKDITTLLFYALKEEFGYLTNNLSIFIDNIYDNINLCIKMVIYFFYGILICFYIFYIVPYIITKNMELNKAKKMLKFIPKEDLYKIINIDSINRKIINKD